MQNFPKNATFISPITQNDIINCCSDIVIKNIMEKVNKGTYFYIFADETTDTSHVE